MFVRQCNCCCKPYSKLAVHTLGLFDVAVISKCSSLSPVGCPWLNQDQLAIVVTDRCIQLTAENFWIQTGKVVQGYWWSGQAWIDKLLIPALIAYIGLLVGQDQYIDSLFSTYTGVISRKICPLFSSVGLCV